MPDSIQQRLREVIRDYIYDCTRDECGHGWTLSAEQTDHIVRLANREAVEALTEARKLIHAMQHQAQQYVEPSGYTAFDRKRIAFDYDQEAKDSLFIGDMIYLLDGPEQREAEAKIDATLVSICASEGSK